MQAELGRDWRVSDLAAAVGVSNRTLQRQFQTFLGETPGGALRRLRFERARRNLLQGEPHMKVMDVAERCGFPHFGRFSVEYRRRYGEAPSQTLRRQTRLWDALASTPMLVPPTRDRPMLAIPPIETDPENADIARDVAEELATALTRAGVAVTSEARLARYRLAGALRGTAAQSRLTFRLIEAESGRHLWAHRSDDVLSGDLTTEQRLATRITAALQPCLRLAEIERAERKPDTEQSSQDLTLRAMPHVLSLDADGNARALELLHRARDRDPSHPMATALAAWAHAQRVIYHFSASAPEERARSAELASKAMPLARDASALAILGNTFTSLRDIGRAEQVVRRALAVDGGSAWAWSRSGWIDLYKGDSDSAIERFMIALELAPHDSLAFNNLVGIGCAHFNAGRYVEAARWQERALIEHPTAAWVHRTLCPAYVLAGAQPEAHRSLTALREHYPELTVSLVQEGLPPLTEAYSELLVGALQAVGLPS